MDDALKQLVVVLTGIIGVAILAVLVSRNSQTPQVFSSFFGGFAQALNAATAPVTGHVVGPSGGFSGLGGFGNLVSQELPSFGFGSYG